ncbi:MAG: nucleotidyltransferase domain-containing protein [Candidatus Atribacteria bacterium]|nr:nucleotidyltransferase domain-containing protein [Candidatus Atribacteria bacterium]
MNLEEEQTVTNELLLLYNVDMLSRVDARIARKVKHRLLKVTPVKRLMVYGSRARGDAASDSDLDLYIEGPVVTPDMRRKISEIAWEVSLETGSIISTLIYSKQLAGQPIIKAIETDGIAV